MTKKVLVTGFEPFDGGAVNPSQELLAFLDRQTFSFELRTKVLPVSFGKSLSALDSVMSDFKPTHVLLTGYAHKRTELTIERIGINWVDARIPDNDGVTLKNQKILETGPDGLFTRLPMEAMMAAASPFVPVKISTSAGEYVCNYVLYSFLRLYPDVPGTFIHIPGADDYSSYFKAIAAIADVLPEDQ